MTAMALSTRPLYQQVRDALADCEAIFRAQEANEQRRPRDVIGNAVHEPDSGRLLWPIAGLSCKRGRPAFKASSTIAAHARARLVTPR